MVCFGAIDQELDEVPNDNEEIEECVRDKEDTTDLIDELFLNDDFKTDVQELQRIDQNRCRHEILTPLVALLVINQQHLWQIQNFIEILWIMDINLWHLIL